jgi:hypothetical protein
MVSDRIATLVDRDARGVMGLAGAHGELFP